MIRPLILAALVAVPLTAPLPAAAEPFDPVQCDLIAFTVAAASGARSVQVDQTDWADPVAGTRRAESCLISVDRGDLDAAPTAAAEQLTAGLTRAGWAPVPAYDGVGQPVLGRDDGTTCVVAGTDPALNVTCFYRE